MKAAEETSRITRRDAMKVTGTALAGVVTLAALSQLTDAGASNSAQAPPKPSLANAPDQNASTKARLRIATCQFPVSGDPAENAKYIRGFMEQAAKAGAHLLHTSEACLSGYPGTDLVSFENYDWAALRGATSGLRESARNLKLWLVLG